MGKRLSQLNQIEQATPENYMLLDGEGFSESKKVQLKDIDIENFNTTKFYNKEQADEKFLSKTSVQQTYNAESENPQSGKAVAEAITQSDDKINKRLPKLTAWTSPLKRVLSLKENIEASQEGTMPDNAYEYINVNNAGSKYDQSLAMNALALRDNNGNLWTYAPVDDEDCVNKKYITDNYIPIKTSELQEYQVYAIPDTIGAKSVDYLTVENPMYFENGQSLGTIPSRQTNGNIMTNAPVKDLDCANKKYVDEKIAEIPSGGGGSIIVDQTYSPTSTNAQSGAAVAEALSGYVVAEVGKGLSSNDFTNEDKEKLYSALQNEDIAKNYNPTSENAQSGKAVAEAVASKADKTEVDALKSDINDIKSGTIQQTPLFANSIDELNASGDTTKLYVLPDGYIYAYINGVWANTQQAFTSFDMLNKLKDACVDEVSVAGTNYNLFKMSEVTYLSRLQDNSADILTKDTLTAQIVSGWIPVEYNKFYTASILAVGARSTVYGGTAILNRVNVKKVDGSIAYNQRAALTTGGATHTSSTIHINSSDIVAVQLNIYVENGDISTPDKLATYETMFVDGDTFEDAHSRALNLDYIDGDEVPPPKIEYTLKHDDTKVDKDTLKDDVENIIESKKANIFSFENGNNSISKLSINSSETDYVYDTSASYGYKDTANGYYVCNGGIYNFGITNAMPLKPETGSYLLSAEAYIPSGNTERTQVSFGVCCYPKNAFGEYNFRSVFSLNCQDQWVKIEKVVSVKDEQDAVYVSFASYIDTYPFYLRNIQLTPILGRWVGKRWVVVGDSITEKNGKTLKNYHDYIAENTGIEVVNMGVSGTGYKNYEDTNNAFYQRILNVPTNADVVTILGSGNDLGGNYTLGDVTDTGTDTLCGCINTTIDNLYSVLPTVQLGIITPNPWGEFNPSDENNLMAQYSAKIVEICRLRGIPCLDLYHCSGLRPWDSAFLELAYPMNNAGTARDSVHPNEIGHSIIAPRIKAFLESLIM